MTIPDFSTFMDSALQGDPTTLSNWWKYQPNEFTTENILYAQQRLQQLLLEKADHKYALLLSGMMAHLNKDYAKAIAFYERGMELGESYAFNNRAHMYYYGEGGVADHIKAFALYEKACNLDNRNAANSLGNLFRLQEKYSEAKKYYEIAIKLKHSDAMVSLGYMFTHGLGVEKDCYRGAQYYQNACELDNNPVAMNNLAYLYDTGAGVIKDPHRSVLLYYKATELGNCDAMIHLGIKFEESQEYDRAIELFEKARIAGHIPAMNCLGRLFANGVGVEKDYPRAMRYYKEAFDLASEVAAANLGRMFELGQGVEPDYPKAIAYYEKAKHSGALYLRGKIYESGSEQVEKNISLACIFYLQAYCQDKHEKALQSLKALSCIISDAQKALLYIALRENQQNEAHHLYASLTKKPNSEPFLKHLSHFFEQPDCGPVCFMNYIDFKLHLMADNEIAALEIFFQHLNEEHLNAEELYRLANLLAFASNDKENLNIACGLLYKSYLKKADNDCYILLQYCANVLSTLEGGAPPNRSTPLTAVDEITLAPAAFEHKIDQKQVDYFMITHFLNDYINTLRGRARSYRYAETSCSFFLKEEGIKLTACIRLALIITNTLKKPDKSALLGKELLRLQQENVYKDLFRILKPFMKLPHNPLQLPPQSDLEKVEVNALKIW